MYEITVLHNDRVLETWMDYVISGWRISAIADENNLSVDDLIISIEDVRI